MNILTFYFSGTGNTKWVVDQLDNLLKEKDHTSAFIAIEDIDDEYISGMIKNVDYVGFAYPLFGANIPKIMRQFIHEIKNNKSITEKLFFINTFAFVNGHGIFEAKKLFIDTEFKIISYVNIRMPNSAPMKKTRKMVNKENFDKKTIRNAKNKLLKFIDHLENSKKYINGIGPHLLMGKLIRRLLRDEIKDNYKHMHVDMQSCTKCMKCIKNCPVECITYEKNEFIFSKDCEACMRCYHGCPTYAISNFDQR